MKIYKSSNIASLQGIATLVASFWVLGVAIGCTVFISKFISFGQGFCDRNIVRLCCCKKAKIRNPMIALRISVLGRSIGYGSLMYENYINFQQEIKQMMLRDYNLTDKKQVKNQIYAIL